MAKKMDIIKGLFVACRHSEARFIARCVCGAGRGEHVAGEGRRPGDLSTADTLAFFRWEKQEQEPDPEGVGGEPGFPLPG